MAPEFFLFFSVAGLALFCVLLIVGIAAPRIPRRLLEFLFSFILKQIRTIFLLALLPSLLLLLLVGRHIHQQYFLNEPLASAAASGDLRRVRQLLERGASPDSSNNIAPWATPQSIWPEPS